MEITSSGPEWDLSEDREIWKQFLSTRTGSRLIPKVLESVPELLAKGHVNGILIRSGEVRGWQMAIQTLLSLSVPEPPPMTTERPTAYPELDDDAKWADGNKLKHP